MVVAKHNMVPAHKGIAVYGTHDLMVKQEAEISFLGPEPAYCIPSRAVKGAVRDWRSRKHLEHWKSMTALRQA
jgi:hypothetical protein